METQKEYSRKDRSVPLETREKISAALKGRPKTTQHKERISAGLKAMWAKIPVASSETQTGYVESGRIV